MKRSMTQRFLFCYCHSSLELKKFFSVGGGSAKRKKKKKNFHQEIKNYKCLNFVNDDTISSLLYDYTFLHTSRF